MLRLDHYLTLDDEVVLSPNLCERFSQDDLRRIGEYVAEGYHRDKASLRRWYDTNEKYMDMAMQAPKAKTVPWPGCSNVSFPLVTISALQFHAVAYPALITGHELVKYKVPKGLPDPQGKFHAIAQAVGDYMSYQLLEDDPSWEEQHDRMLLNVAIVGLAFKKTYYNGATRKNVSELVLAENLVVDYWTKSLDEAARKTHVLWMHRNRIYERVMEGVYQDCRDEPWFTTEARVHTDPNDDRRSKMIPPTADGSTPFKVLEQHCWLDLDGDGYDEPYIITFEHDSHYVLRIVARIERPEDVHRNHRGEVVKIQSREYFTKYGLIPAPDGSFYDIGFGQLLGSLNDSVSTIVNQLIDAGTMANAAGGFLGRGAKMRGGNYSFSPFEWKRVDSTADDLRKSIFPLPVREPSAVLFQLLGMLVSYTQKISGSTDMVLGENPGQNTPATTSMQMIAQGMKVFSAIFKRIWRAEKEEFKKLYILNAIHMPVTGGVVPREYFLQDPDMVVPASSPYILSDEQRLQQVVAIKQSAAGTPGYNMEEVEKKYLRALHVDDVELVYPGIRATGPLGNPKVQIAQMTAKIKEEELKFKQQQFVLQLMEQRRLNTAKIVELEARASKEAEEGKGVEAGHRIAAFEAALGALKARDESDRAMLELMMKGMGNDGERGGTDRGGVQQLGQSSGNGPDDGMANAGSQGSDGGMG